MQGRKGRERRRKSAQVTHPQGLHPCTPHPAKALCSRACALLLQLFHCLPMSLVWGHSWPRIPSHVPVLPWQRFPGQDFAAVDHFYPQEGSPLQFLSLNIHHLSLRLEASRPSPTCITRTEKTRRAHLQVPAGQPCSTNICFAAPEARKRGR